MCLLGLLTRIRTLQQSGLGEMAGVWQPTGWDLLEPLCESLLFLSGPQFSTLTTGRQCLFPVLLGNAARSEVRNGIVMWGQWRSKDFRRTRQVPPSQPLHPGLTQSLIHEPAKSQSLSLSVLSPAVPGALSPRMVAGGWGTQ